MSSKLDSIKLNIENYIRDNRIRPGDKLPSETSLAQHFHVSRTTVRGAIRKLQSEGKLFVKHGSGTYITRPLPTIPSSLDRLYSIGDMIRTAGLQEDEQLEYIVTQLCPPEIAERMGLKQGEEIVVLERTRMADGEAVAHSINYMPQAIAGAIIENGSFSGSLFNHLEEKAGIRIVGSNSELTVPPPSDPICKRLLQQPQSTVLLLKQLHYDEINRQVLYSLDYVRSDIFTFWIKRTR
ncbi:GntR family transcriptional regulator [Paenibacillus beijingensis]|uniref:GntR family transcriptional regulator n=1 Tax=Paenibacillus beijingensis TaxID=1126833 RepID=A0A0D5NKD1_9BACL|nr:GntR family transcriptional regulator [Paenibacillus beijingensis]AJY75595.1 GntR family transcriptional regulator [Paenibacillus beijingensis]